MTVTTAPAPSPRKTLAVCGGAHALHDGFTDLLNVLYPLLQAQFGLSYAAIGTLKAIYSGAMASGQIPSGWLARRLGGVTILAAGTLLGQIPPAATADNTAAKSPLATRPLPTLTDDVLELSPFTVKASSEEGWSASSTLLGNRINQDLVKVPVTVDVLTRDFFNDVGVFNMDDAAAFVSGVTVVPRLEARNDDGRLTFRGLTGSADTSRNFFKWSVPSDTYNVERFDFGKGSNSSIKGGCLAGVASQ